MGADGAWKFAVGCAGVGDGVANKPDCCGKLAAGEVAAVGVFAAGIWEPNMSCCGGLACRGAAGAGGADGAS